MVLGHASFSVNAQLPKKLAAARKMMESYLPMQYFKHFKRMHLRQGSCSSRLT